MATQKTKEKVEARVEARADASQKPNAKEQEASSAKTRASKNTVTHSGVTIEGKVIAGKKPKLTPKEQGQLARGEIDESGDPTGKAKPLPGSAGDVTMKSDQPLYHGWLTAKATAAATGQPVSVRWEQAEPTTEDGLFHSFQAYHPSAIRDTFEVDPENKTDPTLRTYLEK